MQLLLRGVLAERFKLQFTTTNRMRPVDALVIAPGGLKMKPITATDGCSPAHLMALAHKEVPNDAVGGAIGCSTSDLVRHLNAIPQNTPDCLPVIDRTGLTGRYPIVVWQRALGFRKVGNSYKWDSLEPFNEALKRELGLEMIKTTAPYRVLHVTRIEKPTPN